MASPDIVLTVRLLRWGNSFGLRVSRADVQRAGLKPDQDLTVRIAGKADKIDLSHLPTFDTGATDVSERMDDYLDEYRDARIRRGSHAAGRRQ